MEAYQIIVKKGALVDASIVDTPLKPKGKPTYKVETPTAEKDSNQAAKVEKEACGRVARYRGLAKMHTQNLLEAICYNLYRSSGIIASNCKK